MVRRVLDTISSEDSTNQRVNLLYLMDSILQVGHVALGEILVALGGFSALNALAL